MGEYYRIEEICRVKGGKRIPQGCTLQDTPNSHPYIRILDMYQGRILNISEEMQYAKDEYWDSIKNYTVKNGDVILAIVGNTLGMASIVGDTLDSANLTENCCKFDNLDTDKVRSLFLYYALIAPINQKNIEKFKVGSSQPKLPIYNINQLLIPKISLKLQDKIIGVLSAIDTKIENNSKINAELESMAKTIYDYWFLQFEFPNEEGKPYKSSGGKMVWNEELKREIPAGWEIDSLGELFVSNRGISYSSKTIKGKGVPMINLASFNMDGSYKKEGIKTYSGQYAKDKVVKPFDLLMCNTQQTAIDYKKDIIGKAFLVPDIFEGDVVTSHHVTTIQVKRNNMKYFLHRLFNTDYFHKYAAGFTNGTNILGLIFSGIEKYRVEIPTDSILDKFAKLMSDIEMKKSKIIKENQELTSLKDFLLPLLMNGQIEFQD
ncbi:MAG: restriction endonuclease subunit S [Clostridium sp.]|nr:restriction endonuclease subunit S [Clostridium sp.]